VHDDSSPEEPPATQQLSIADRNAKLSEYIATKTLVGYIVVHRDENNATAVLSLPGKPVNNVLHAIISIFTCGLWIIVWVILAASQRREQRIRSTVDQYGRLREEGMFL
jgi:hypothetical protein